MIHPLLVVVLATDAVAVVMLVAAARTAMAVVTDWHPESPDRTQLDLEARNESALLWSRLAFLFLAVSTGLLVLGIAEVLPAAVPGAMCGTGVLQAMGGSGGKALAFRLAAIAILFAWQVIDRIDQQSPNAPLAKLLARAFLLALPFVLLGTAKTVEAVASIDIRLPVDCCTAVYDRFQPRTGLAAAGALPDRSWVALALLLGIPLMLAAANGCRPPAGRRTIHVVAVLSPLWVAAAAIALVRVLAAYHYEVLDHHCPWCLFLPEHACAGLLLYGSLVVVALEGPAAWLAAGLADRYPDISDAAGDRAVSACRRLLAAITVFALAAGLPALLWRLRHGVWMG